MEFEVDLEKTLKQYKERVATTPPDCIVFYAYIHGSEVSHMMCHEAQIPAIKACAERHQPDFIMVRKLGPIQYEHTEEV